MATFTLTGTAKSASGLTVATSKLITIASSSTSTIIDGRDIRANTSLVGCRIPAAQLTSHSGDWTAKAGETITGMWIHGQYTAATNSAAVDCKIDSSINTYPAEPAGVVITHCDIGQVGVKSGAGSPGLRFGGATIQFCHVAGFSDGAFMNNGISTLDACWIHGILQTEATDEHNDTIQMSNGSGVTVNRCWLDRDDNLGEVSCLGIYKADNGPITSCVLTNNLVTNPGGTKGVQALIWHSGKGGGCSGGVFTGNFIGWKQFSIVFNSDQPASSYHDANNMWIMADGTTTPMTFANGGTGQM